MKDYVRVNNSDDSQRLWYYFVTYQEIEQSSKLGDKI